MFTILLSMSSHESHFATCSNLVMATRISMVSWECLFVDDHALGAIPQLLANRGAWC